MIARGEARKPDKIAQRFCGASEAEPRDKPMRATMLFVLIPPPSPKNRRFFGLGGGILFKRRGIITHVPGVDTPRYQMSPLRGFERLRFLGWEGGYCLKEGVLSHMYPGLTPRAIKCHPSGVWATLLFRRNGLRAVKRCCILSVLTMALSNADTYSLRYLS